MLKKLLSSALCLLLSAQLTGCINAPTADDAAATKQPEQSSGVAGQKFEQAEAPAATEAPRYSGPIEFTDVTAQAGIRFKHNSGAFGKKYLPETMGVGLRFSRFR